MKTALITGAAGFVGQHLIKHIQTHYNWSIAGTKMAHETIEASGVDIFDLNILDIEGVDNLMSHVQPDFIFHLAAQSSVSESWKNPSLTIDVNIKGTLNVLSTAKKLKNPPKILLVGSGEEYGNIESNTSPVKENNIVRPGNIYAATKVFQTMVGKIFVDAYEMQIVNARPFNHIGPGQSPVFAVADFCRQAVEIERGKQFPVIHTGNLDVIRDFTDVRDIVQAYTALLEYGRSGETYNIGCGKGISLRNILDTILKYAKTDIESTVDSAKLRPVDIPVLEADVTKIQTDTGWKAKIPLEETLKDMLDFWRNK